MSVPTDDGVRRRHAFLVDAEPTPMLLAEGALITREEAIDLLRQGYNRGNLKAETVQLIDYAASTGGKPGQFVPRDLGEVDVRAPVVGSPEFRRTFAPVLSHVLGTTVNTEPPDGEAA